MVNMVGQKLGNYQLVRLIGQGGFADVYLGVHVHLQTKAAIKVLHMRLASESLETFLREARLIAHLDHPHIVRVLEFGVENTVPFLVMSFASYGSLRHRYPEGTKAELSSIVSYVRQIGDALDYAHSQKLVHRDIKPENILLSAQSKALLGDFGIAIMAQSSKTPQAQEVVGTVAYMAPEQLQGKPVPASDQYALGVIVYEWLCGERPFKGTFIELFSQHVAVPPPPLSERFPFISPEIEHAVMRALAKRPEDRFENVKAFANAFEQACKEQGTIVLNAPIEPTFIPTPPTHPMPPSLSIPLHQANPPATLSLLSSPVNATVQQESANITPSLPLSDLGAKQQSTEAISSQPNIHSVSELINPSVKRPEARVNSLSMMLSVIAVLVIVLAGTAFVFRPPFLFNVPSSSSRTVSTQDDNLGSRATSTPDVTGTASAYATAATAASANATATSTASQLIYQVTDWTTWQGSAHWKVVGANTYGSDGTSDGNLEIAWAPSLNLPQNYAIEATVTFVRTTDNFGDYEIDLVGRGNGSSNGYVVGVYSNNCGIQCNHEAAVSLIRNPYGIPGQLSTQGLSNSGYTLDTNPHTFRAEFQDNSVKFYIDNSLYISTTDNTYINPGRVGLYADATTEVDITSFKVFTL